MDLIQLTTRQRKVLDFIKRSVRECGCPPAYGQIAIECGTPLNAVRGHLFALAMKGAIRITPNAPRGIQLVGEGGRCPMCGAVK
jgi:repressor LexA